MSDSRLKLLEWVNELLQLRYTKVEQLGTGVAYSQIIDSIYGDVQLSKLKIDGQHERAYIDNFKVIQQSFEKHEIDKDIPVNRLVKCKFQDNLEFLQWLKSFWNEKYNGRPYDAAARRQKALGHILCGSPSSSSGPNPCASLSTSTTTNSNGRSIGGGSDNDSKKYSHNNKRNRDMSSSSSPSITHRPTPIKIMELNQKVSQLQMTIKQLQHENQIYLEKLESIKRVLIKSYSHKHNKPGTVANILQKINTILYSEKDDFE